MANKIPVMIFPVKKLSKLVNPFQKTIGGRIAKRQPNLEYDLREAGIEFTPEYYCTASFYSSLMWGGFLAVFTLIATLARGIAHPFITAGAVGFVFFALLLFLHLWYPKILARKIAESVEKELIFALKELHMQVGAGVPLFEAMSNIAKSDYGKVSREFDISSKQVTAGTPEIVALERMALRTNSEHLKRALWQIITAMRSGSSVANAVKSEVDLLLSYKYRAIKSYSSELNFMILMYLLFAAVTPSIGLTLIILLSGFGGIKITPEFFMAMIALSFVAQVILIGIIRSRRPELGM
ncbi:Type II secretion system (T2SS), protein F [Candidatus Gugararchaeum adminiculabundum]|nr:Type II secretion system (T2SS), protein F [Candidatus Gugararchaeum adminiculabundum]